ncbi:MAG TPA: hypothetical protein VN428_26205 [Bryobacteraceae bacterium]|nr:hypothetical protein [Bryobacteraceae bacterium]
MTWRRVGSLTWEFISVSALSLVLGIGVGFFQGDLSTGSQLGDIRMTLPNEGAMTGALFSLPIGWVAYYAILRRKVSFELFRSIIGAIVLSATVVGLAVGYLTQGQAAFASSLLMIPIVLITVGLMAAQSKE